MSREDGTLCSDVVGKDWAPTLRVSDILGRIVENLVNPSAGLSQILLIFYLFLHLSVKITLFYIILYLTDDLLTHVI